MKFSSGNYNFLSSVWERFTAPGVPRFLVPAVLAVLVLSIYWQVGGHGFVNIDDGIYVYENPVVLRGLTLEGISWAFSTFTAANWHPLTWLSHMLDVELFGASAGKHHLMNLLYHLLNTELLFFVLWRMTGGLWQSAFVAAMFGVHPLHVESAAWIAERKDVLSTLFWILAMGAYLRYVRRPGTGRYLLLAAVFALGLMCKPMLVTLPFVLLLLDWWPLRRFAQPDSPHSAFLPFSMADLARLVREKVPLLGLSAISCAVTFLAQSRGEAVESIGRLSIGERIVNAFLSLVIYLEKTIWPSSLAVYYPHPGILQSNLPAWKIAGAILLTCGLALMAFRQGRRRPYLAVGWLWYVGTLIPVIGLVQVGAQAYADRYTYVPLIGVFMAVAWGIPPEVTERRFGRIVLAVFTGVSLAALTVTARVQAGYWRDSVTLLSRTVAVTDRNWFALNNLGAAYNSSGQYREAAGHLREALRVHPGNAEAWNNLGRSFNGLGQFQDAVACIREALRIQPGNMKAWNNLGVSHGEMGQYPQAIGAFREALRIQPENLEAWNNLGLTYGRVGQYPQAIGAFREALRIRPDHAEGWNHLGVSYANIGQYQMAMDCFREAVRLKPDYSDALDKLEMSRKRLER
jgi:tetratricopeptide (TPR) repeat protein